MKTSSWYLETQLGKGWRQQKRDSPTRNNGNGDGGDARERLGSGERGIEASAVAPLAM
jgi:hypothetical protein